MATTKRYDVKDLALAAEGVRRIEWADRQMPVLAAIRERFETEQPLSGYRVSACLHVTTETANLMRTLKAGGADVVLCASNPLSTQDDVAAALVDEFDVSVFAIKGEDNDTYYAHIEAAVDHKPHLTMDDGADVIGVLHSHRRELLGDIIAGTEETTTGVIRLRALEARRRARVPDHRGQRGEHEAPVRQPLRHRPVDDRRDHPRHERPARRQALRRRRLRLGRPRRRVARAGHGRARHRHRGRSAAGARGGDGRLRGDADGRRRPQIGDIFFTATGDKHVIAQPAHGADEGRRDPRQHRPLQRRDRHPGAEVARVRDAACAPVRRGVHARERPAALPARGRPAREPRRGRGPSGARDGHVVRQPGARGRVRRPERRRRSSGRSTSCRTRSTARSRGSSSRRWASRSTS